MLSAQGGVEIEVVAEEIPTRSPSRDRPVRGSTLRPRDGGNDAELDEVAREQAADCSAPLRVLHVGRL